MAPHGVATVPAMKIVSLYEIVAPIFFLNMDYENAGM
jgi:hypothetical protein